MTELANPRRIRLERPSPPYRRGDVRPSAPEYLRARDDFCSWKREQGCRDAAPMDATEMPEAIDLHRRRFVGAAATAIAAAHLGVIGSAAARSAEANGPAVPAVTPGASASFGPLKQVDAGVLSVGYAEAGPADGPPVMLLHGWPYDIHSYAEVAPLLASAGYRVIVPYLRGYGTTRFLSDATAPQRPAGGARRRRHRLDGRARHREGHPRRLRLGRADGRHRRRALAGALQGPGLGERLSDRQPGGRQDAAAAAGRAAVVVPVLLRDRARSGRLRRSTGASSPS